MKMQISHARCSTRREDRRQVRRDAIVAVASQSFLEHGYAATSMSAIAARMGGSKGTLWSYFPSKAELFAAVIDEKTATYRARLSEILNPSGELVPTLQCFCTSFIEKVTSPEAIRLHRLVVAEVGRFPEVGKIFYDRAPRLTHTSLADFLSSGMERGFLRKEDPLCAARLLVSLCLSGCHQQMLMGLLDVSTSELMNADVDRALTVFLRAYSI